MIKYCVIFVLSFCFLRAAAQFEYLGETPPTTAINPLLFGAGKISTGYNERDLTISPDGKEIYFSIQYSFTRSVIAYVKYENGKWGRVKVAPFSSLESADIEPAFAPSGNRLFFASKRSGDFDIWYVDRQGDGWSAPVNAGSNVNTGQNEFYPSVTSGGALYYTAPYSGNEDIWVSTPEGSGYSKPVALPGPVSTAGGEFNAYITPGGETIYYSSESSGRGDIYTSTKSGSEWSEPSRLLLNSGALDYCPSRSPDGSYLFFTSERGVAATPAPNPFEVSRVIKAQTMPKGSQGNIYWSK